ncbi:MAG: cytochrome c3 family protein [Chlamydiota bacterium]|nr:cytochrome c3 family protein [Chlamydiota bacterium]
MTNASYSLYDSATLDVSLEQPSGISKLCLSCHDGTVAIDSYGENTGTAFMIGSENVGTDLTNDHPISFTYDSNLATTDGELNDPSVQVTALGGTISHDLLFNGKVECASCHDVHNTASEGNSKLLVINNAGSALCITCHNK